jgi:O-antigen/teichoic acid export membrane protein
MNKKILLFIGNIKKNKFIGDSKNYIFAELFNKGLIFFTIPIFTRILTPEEYGILGVFNSVVAIFTILIGLNLNSSIIVRYSENKTDFNFYLGANLNVLLISILILSSLSILNYEIISKIFKINKNIFICAIFTSGFISVAQFYQSYLQSIQLSKKYAILSVLKNITLIICSTLMMYLMENDKYYGVIYSNLLIGGVFAIVCLYGIKNIVKLNFKYQYIKYGLIFCLPLIPHSLSGIVFSQVDRLMIDRYLGPYQVGL